MNCLAIRACKQVGFARTIKRGAMGDQAGLQIEGGHGLAALLLNRHRG